MDVGNENGEFKIEAIQDSAVYTKESESDHLPRIYYLVSWKGYPEEKTTWEPASAIQQLRKLIRFFYKAYPDKPTATPWAIDTIPQIARPTVKPVNKPSIKRK